VAGRDSRKAGKRWSSSALLLGGSRESKSETRKYTRIRAAALRSQSSVVCVFKRMISKD